jgi:XTP/dITP diphosphohydrolase
MDPIVLATANPHKVDELRAILAAGGFRAVGLHELAPPTPPEPAESGTTFEANATIKALAYARATGRLCLADDSGLEVDALGGRPGVISSHYSTDGAETGLTRAQRDHANNARLLRELEGLPPESRSARFVCVMALATPERLLTLTRGTFEGRIGLPGDVPRGANGFGYDPLFLVAPDFAKTGAELPTAEKNARSHRAAAARAMLEHLRTHFV